MIGRLPIVPSVLCTDEVARSQESVEQCVKRPREGQEMCVPPCGPREAQEGPQFVTVTDDMGDEPMDVALPEMGLVSSATQLKYEEAPCPEAALQK